MDIELEQELNSIIENEAEKVHEEVRIINTEIAEYLEQALYEEDDDLGQNEHYLFAIYASEAKALVSEAEIKIKMKLVTSNHDIYELLTSQENIKDCANAVGLLLMAHCTDKAKKDMVRVSTLISEAGMSAIVRKENNPTEIERINHDSIPQESQLIRTLIAFHTFTQIQKDNQ